MDDKNFDIFIKIKTEGKESVKDFDKLIATLKGLENLQKKGLGSKEAAVSMRALKLEGQALRNETEKEKTATESLKNLI